MDIKGYVLYVYNLCIYISLENYWSKPAIKSSTVPQIVSFTNIIQFLERQVVLNTVCYSPDSKVHVANMGPIWGRQNPGGPHISPMNLAILELLTPFLTWWP